MSFNYYFTSVLYNTTFTDTSSQTIPIIPASCIEDAPRFADLAANDTAPSYYAWYLYSTTTSLQTESVYWFNWINSTYYSSTYRYFYGGDNSSSPIYAVAIEDGGSDQYDGGNAYFVNDQPFEVWEAYHQSFFGAEPVYSTVGGVDVYQHVQRAREGRQPEIFRKYVEIRGITNISLFYNATEYPNLNLSTVNRSDSRLSDTTSTFSSSDVTWELSRNTTGNVTADIAALFFGTAGPVAQETTLTIAGNLGADGDGQIESQTMSYNGLYGFRKTVCGAGDGGIHHLWLTDDANALHRFPNYTDTDFDQLTISAQSSAAVVTYFSGNPGCGGDAAHEAYFQELAMFNVGTECVSSTTTTDTTTTDTTTTTTTTDTTTTEGTNYQVEVVATFENATLEDYEEDVVRAELETLYGVEIFSISAEEGSLIVTFGVQFSNLDAAQDFTTSANANPSIELASLGSGTAVAQDPETTTTLVDSAYTAGVSVLAIVTLLMA